MSSFDQPAMGETPGHKHLLIEVPNYDRSAESGPQPKSYLKLGGAPGSGASARERGDDLLEFAGLTDATEYFYQDDYRKRADEASASRGGDAEPPRKEDRQHPETVYHRRDGHEDRTDSVMPQALTRELTTRGGWRDHTDGNRITTTRGDKVEVIDGNYKQVIFGRRAHHDEATGTLVLPDDWRESFWETSGGHHTWSTSNKPGRRVSTYWCDETKTWRVVDETIKGDLYERYHGIVEKQFIGESIIREIGGEKPTEEIEACSTTISQDQPAAEVDDQWIDPAGREQQRPIIHETIYADSIRRSLDTTTGYSDKSEHADFDEKVYAGVITEKRDADKKFTEKITVDADVTMTDVIGKPKDAPPGSFDKISDFNEKLKAVYIEEHETFKTKHDTYQGGITIGFGYQNSLEFILGAKHSLYYAFRFGLMGAATAGICVSAAADIKVGLFLKCALGPTIEAEMGNKLELKMVTSDYAAEANENYLLKEIFVVSKSWTGGHHAQT